MNLILTEQTYPQLVEEFDLGKPQQLVCRQITPKNLTGLVAGITSTYSINEGSGITVDLLYSGEGYKSGNQDIALNYLESTHSL